MGINTITVDGVKMTHGEYEQLCRNKKAEDAYYTDDEIADKCSYLAIKYKAPFSVGRDNWFDKQIDVAFYLGLDWLDLYRKVLNLDNLFHAAYLQKNVRVHTPL